MLKITPNGNNCIVRLIPNDERIGQFYIAESAKEKPTIAEVMIPPKYSYHPNGELKDSILNVGMLVRLPKGQCGTGMPESPSGEEWICIAEDLIEYTTEEQDHE